MTSLAKFAPKHDAIGMPHDRGAKNFIARARLRQEQIENHPARARREQAFRDKCVDFTRPGPARGDEVEGVTFGTGRRHIGVERLQIELREIDRAAVDPEKNQTRVRRQNTPGSGDRSRGSDIPNSLG